MYADNFSVPVESSTCAKLNVLDADDRPEGILIVIVHIPLIDTVESSAVSGHAPSHFNLTFNPDLPEPVTIKLEPVIVVAAVTAEAK